MDMKLILLALQCLLYAVCEEEFPLRPDFLTTANTKYYVDKTLCVKEFMEDPHRTIFIQVASRFGKTTNLQMMKYFLEINVHDENRTEIIDKENTYNFQFFTHTKIYKEQPDFFKKHFGKYPVIYVECSHLSHFESYEDLLDKWRETLFRAYNPFAYMYFSDSIFDDELNVTYFHQFLNKRLSFHIDESDIRTALPSLGKLVYRYFKKRPIYLLDDYGSYMNTVIFGDRNVTKIAVEMFNFMHTDFFNQSKALAHKVLCTGVMHMTGKGLSFRNFPDSYLHNYLFLNDHRYSGYYGLLDHELQDFLKRFTNSSEEFDTLLESIRHQYKGYVIFTRGVNVYNIYSIIKHIESRQRGVEPLKSYWSKPDYYSRFLYMFYNAEVKLKLTQMLKNRATLLESKHTIREKSVKHFRKIYHDWYLFPWMRRNVNAVLHFLLLSGYLTYDPVFHRNVSLDNIFVHLVLPSLETRYELRQIFVDSLMQQFDFKLATINEINDIVGRISEDKHHEAEFEQLFIDIKSLFCSRSYHPRTDAHFMASLITIFGIRYQVFTTTDVDFNLDIGRFNLMFNTSDKIVFNVGIKMILIKEPDWVVDGAIINCTAKLVDKLVTLGYYNLMPIHENKSIVKLGLCLGLTLYENGTINNTRLGLGHVIQLRGSETVGNKTIIYNKAYNPKSIQHLLYR